MVTTNYAPFFHDVDNPDHGRAFRITDEGGNDIEVAAGRARIDQTVFNFAAATPFAGLANGVNYVYIDNAGAITVLLGGPYPANSIPLARVTVAAGDVTGVADDRCFFSESTGGGVGGSSIFDADADTGIDVDEADDDYIHLYAALAGVKSEVGRLSKDNPTLSYLKLNSQEDLDGDTKIQVEEAADEDKVRMDVAGTERFLLQDSASPYLTITGNTKLIGSLALKGTNPSDNAWLGISPILETWLSDQFAIQSSPAACTLGAINVDFTGLLAQAACFLGSFVNLGLVGLFYSPSFSVNNNSPTVREIASLKLGGGIFHVGAADVTTVTDSYMARIFQPGHGVFGGALNVGNHYQIKSETVALSVIANCYGLHMGDINSASVINRILELGPAVSGGVYLRLEGSTDWAPAINTRETPLYLAAGNNDNPLTITMRQVEWMDPGVGGVNFAGGERVMILR